MLDVPEVVFSHAVIGAGTRLYQQVVAAGHEGVVAKAPHLATVE
jgi:ATP-dependent DNA ligase